MAVSSLVPSLQLLRKDYVLIQAWKKTARYVRSHNSFSDTLALDLTEINLPEFINDLKQRLGEPENWNSLPIRIVLAPKSQAWGFNGDWGPLEQCRLRPLAHLKLRDQVAATAVMLCLADQVETVQRDPTLHVCATTPSKVRPISYGNRLFCDWNKNTESLRHRWGSSVLYRGYYDDYRKIITRPMTIAEHYKRNPAANTYIVHADLREFYDRISPALLYAAVNQQLTDAGEDFKTLVKNLFCWTWHKDDLVVSQEYAATNKIDHFTTIALPQGLVSAGFFANILMLGMDESLRNSINQEIIEHVTLVDACRYVDDFRFVMRVSDKEISAKQLRKLVNTWLQGKLDDLALSLGSTHSSLLVSDKKTKIVSVSSQGETVISQSQRMNRIQQDISGGIDANQGMQILTAVEALISSQRRYTTSAEMQQWAWLPIPDTDDGTVKRFAAGRYRKTFRSIRPPLENRIGPEIGRAHV